ncbi:MAG: sulfur carrier protein ThiS [Planctomycetota bacterium]
MITVTANGTEHQLPEGTTVDDLIARLGLAESICAAEVNKSVVPRAERADKKLQTGDTVEIVTLVGGG